MLRPRTMLLTNALIGHNVPDPRFCDQNKMTVYVFLWCFIVCAFFVWSFCFRWMCELYLNYMFCVTLSLALVLHVMLCLTCYPFKLIVNVFYVMSYLSYVNSVYYDCFMYYTQFLVFMSAPYTTHESWHIKR